MIETGFSATSTADEVIAGIDLAGKRAVVTGGASGIGIETARVLAGASAEVTIAVRNVDAGQETAEQIHAANGAKVQVAELDLASPASVRAFVANWDGPLHILINNAGVMAPPLTRTPEGWELQFATNHLGHFGLATGLYPALAAGHARVVSVASSGHLFSPVVFEDIHFTTREYQPWVGYGQSKTANILFAVEANKRWADAGITVNSLHPGSIATNLQRHVSQAEIDRMRKEVGASMLRKTPAQGASTSILVATSPLLTGIGGKYFEDCNEAAPNQPGAFTGVAPHALDPEAAERLWKVSLDTLG
ncbi:NAD(P)-dependent dehydrogenase (short-subunit alcohol dehydrogenase family) [Kibdelosporangium banguiense]|uniref:NAD(P)-dependent dehydrogenase (Short-subunit alcohol dehydrogenase family) n=1 Tax=Kibdelosporangium banguiense TaxID=1365924 RepID=A0ABS4TDN3_9PSEU|nr:SDR family NAD(P)-dependent oxidoreductase [Kibdelosporangium banguiense]MBP2322533.1 NAD(P)-dependent dehydrogenase (short-subunit alcohol dehydrogenase family) [Kibdelosporangium banguiense]